METILEGTWEEIARHADELAGKRVRLTVLAEANGADNEHLMFTATPEEWTERVDRHAEIFKGFPGLPDEAFDR
jgi:hypothetical protein